MSGVFVAGEEAPAMTVHAGFAPAQVAKLCSQVAGSGPSVVLLHGFSFDRRMWDDQMDALTPHHTVVRYDLRGFGESPPGSTPYTHADDLNAVMDHLGIERAAVVGLSLGGGAAINFAITPREKS
ncbi:MAG TPA: alpha/beta fold hydrolase [Gemmatimonadaceae bacterium]|nr:alpha/beta fold hydrolase [Gemmatimonadaceae bacterium]